jgi:hypothetical protein
MTASKLLGWAFGIAVFVAGLLNAILVHPVPGAAYLMLSLIYLPPANELMKKRFGFSIHPALKIVLGIILFFFTLGVSDLGDILV